MNRLIFGPSIRVSILLASFVLIGCTGIFSGNLFKERAAETPAPHEYGVDKTFFVDANGKPKTFLCAWAPEVSKGWFGELTGVAEHEAAHCNVEFEITETALIAKLINPSFLNDRSRWYEMLRIPIEKHFYYERNKDQYGRETNEWIENSSRSHWSARPKIKLNLLATKITQVTSSEGSWGWKVSSVQDIEWDFKNNFLGFSLDAQYTIPGAGQTSMETRLRLNFLKFDHDPNFKKVPYHQENSRYLNVLHVMGRFHDGLEPELYAARWDLSKTTKFYLNGVPKEHQATVLRAIEHWNKEFQEIGAVPKGFKAFEGEVKEMKHPFDLRYPSITWISDRRMSLNAPLGIGQTHADVRNGKILWGGVVIWGGMLEQWINSYAPLETTAPAAASEKNPYANLTAMLPAGFPLVDALNPTNAGTRAQMLQSLSVDHKNFLNQKIIGLKKSDDPTAKATAEALNNQLLQIQSMDPQLNKILADLSNSIKDQNTLATEYLKRHTLADLVGAKKSALQGNLVESLMKEGKTRIANALKEPDRDKRMQKLNTVSINGSPFFIESELTVENKVGAWMSSPGRNTRQMPEILESVVASLTVHEIGHVLGLGHQFKENIVPEEGTVPSAEVKKLAEKATPEKEFTNMTSVMGYQSGRTEVMTPASEYVPGPQDRLALRYIYTGRYSVYDKAKDKWEYPAVPPSGRIPEVTRLKDGTNANVSYFPACNDWEASLAADPFCNRFDRGNKATEVVNSYFEMISDNLLANMYSLVGGGSYSDRAEMRLWFRGFDTFSRVRLFYDEMRRRLRSDRTLAPLWDKLRNDSDALLEFSNACKQNDPTKEDQVRSEVLREIFADKSMVDLCRANALALKEFSFFLTLPESDYTRIDHSNRYIQGGYLAGDTIRSYGTMFGSWYQMSNLPLKISSFYSVTTANSYLPWGLWPNPYYDNEENRFLYRTLYPTEFTRLVSNTVESNMRFAAAGRDRTTTMGRTVLYSGFFLPWSRMTSNDSARLPREFNDMLNQQTQFNFSVVAILIEAVTPDAKENVKADHYKKFTASIYDFMTGKPATARDVFLLPNGDVFVWANGMFLYPISKVKFYSGTSSYVIAYKVDYDQGPRDPLVQDSLKTTLMEKHEEIANVCVKGFANNGLAGYFNSTNPDFDGFKILSGIATETGQEKLGAFYDSLDTAFKKYEKAKNKDIPDQFPIRTMPRICEESVRGVGEISAAAAMANGFWLGITADYVEK